MSPRRQQAEELRRHIEWALARAADPSNVLPMLHRLTRLAADGSEDGVFANLHLAELLVERDPWRAALHARRVVRNRADDDRGWATLALCQTFLGNYKFAVSAYHRAIASAPKNPWYSHNLGHLLDVALGRAPEAISWLKRAYDEVPASGEVASSYAHALARVGRLSEARKVLTRAMKHAASREHAALLKWVDQGAPPERDHSFPRPVPVRAVAPAPAGEPDERDPLAGPARVSNSRAASDDVECEARLGTDSAPGRRSGRPPLRTALDAALTRGLANLPLDAKQRARAKAIARDASTYFAEPARLRAGTPSRAPMSRAAVQAVAAAIAFAIVYVDHVPLTQTEVAACFRVGVASLRGRFSELRARLDLTPGDTRYATLRRH